MQQRDEPGQDPILRQVQMSLPHGLEVPVNAPELEVPHAECSYELEAHPAELGPEIGKGSSRYLQSMVSRRVG